MSPSRKLLVPWRNQPSYLPIMSISHSNPSRFETSRSSAIPISETASSDSRESSAFLIRPRARSSTTHRSGFEHHSFFLHTLLLLRPKREPRFQEVPWVSSIPLSPSLRRNRIRHQIGSSFQRPERKSRIATSDPPVSSQIDLKSGKSITAWIDYKKVLCVY
ncbi:unnamed protein product [Microthlaspi erraticum]|uniref:Uncharacterized protein n=1 Tax=Microthlaspi erraticum TaxID=1685480 RepID=A0A6D2K162_9BRAS|nr:unnamed protein product [Microthlaspi erraticum]